MKIEEFFESAKKAGISEAQIQVQKNKSLSMSLFHHEMDNYNVNDSQSIVACGIYQGKFGSCRTEKIDASSTDYLIKGIIDSAGISEKNNKASLFKGSEKYHKKNTYHPELAKTPIEKKIALLHTLEEGLFAYDKRINEVEAVQYAESESNSEFYNTSGLKLKQKTNYFVIVASINGKVDNEVKTAFDVAIGDDLASFDAKAFIAGLGKQLLAKFGSIQCASGKYPTVIKNTCFADIVDYFVSAASSDEIQKKSSFLVGKLGQKVASSKVNISEKPLTKNVFFSYFDDEGVARNNQDIVKKGVLSTYLYNQETAAKDGRASTGNGRWAGDKIGIGYSNIVVKGSRHSFAEMIAPIKEGVYITDIEGLMTGMNENSGDFSCQAQGFVIRNGALAEPLSLITLSGNLLAMLQGVKGVDDNSRLWINSVTCPDVYVSKMSIGGK